MGLISGALIGGAEGFGTGLAKAGELEHKDEHERMKEQAQAIREERNIRLTGEQTRQTQAAKPEIIPAGSTIQRPGQPDLQAPEKPQSEEEKAVMRAHANYYNAAARAATAKEPKATLPKVIVKDDGQGNAFLFDENSGAVGTVIPGAAAKEAVSHWFSQNEPGKSAQPNNIIWKGPSGDVLPNGLVSFYPDLQKRTPAGTGAPASAQPGARPSLASFMPGTQAAPAAPAQAPSRAPAATQPAAQVTAQPQGPASGNAVDAARTKLSAAQQTLQSYGLMQQRRDPQGYAAAQQAVAAAKQDLDASMSQYQNDLGPVGAAKPLLRMK